MKKKVKSKKRKKITKKTTKPIVVKGKSSLISDVLSFLLYFLGFTLICIASFIPKEENKNKPSMKTISIPNDFSIDIKIDKAWEKTLGSRDIVVAVIDTGIDTNHFDLKNNLWTNKNEIPNNGIDDDNNGCVDDIHGCNMIDSNGDLTDNHGHGTHISGIIGAEGRNKKGFKGIAPKVKIMGLKYYDPRSPGHNNLINTIKAVDYAIKMKADIINYSAGGLVYSQIEYEAFKRAKEAGILVVVSAGNEKLNIDTAPYFPASYDLDNLLVVANADESTLLASSSNYGKNKVHLAAPGVNIYSTLPGGKYGFMSGTSMSAPFVSGIAVLLKAKYPEMTYLQIKERIVSRSKFQFYLKNKVKSSGTLNAENIFTIIPEQTHPDRSIASK